MADHIQIGDISPRIQYTGDGTQTAFTYPFPIFKDADIEVYKGTTQKILTTDYTVSGAGNSAGGTVKFATAPASTVVVTLKRNIDIARTSDFQESGEFRAKVINDELDTLTATLQQIESDQERSLRLAPTDSAGSTELPDKATRASKFLAFDTSGDPIAAEAVTGITASTFGASLMDDADAAAAHTTLGLVIGTDVLAPTGDGSGLTGITTGATDSEKANIALNAFRIAVNGGLSAQNMVDGVVDEFEDETGVDTATSTNETYSAANDYYTNQGTSQIAQGTGTAIGNLTGTGGLAAAFDSNTAGTSATLGATTGYIGKSWTGTKTVSGFKIWSDPSVGFVSVSGAGTVTITLQGSTDNFSSSIVDLGNTSVSEANGQLVSLFTGITTTTDYAYHRLKVDTSAVSGATDCFVCEVEFYEGSGALDMTLLSNATTALAQPDTIFSVLWQEDVDAATAGTDYKVYGSRDGGTTYTEGALTVEASLTSGQILVATVDVSAQPAGTSMKWKVETLNTKEMRLHGIGLEWS